MFPMDISSIAAPTPVKTPETSASKAPEVKADSGAEEARAAAAQPPVLAALPPGQGTRINQIA
jgi:hypothetical protein